MRMSRTRAVVAVVSAAVVLPWLGACGGEGTGARAGEGVADSAGVTVVETTREAWRAGEGWAVDPEPVVSVGDGDVAFERIVGTVRLDDGRTVVLDAGSGRVRWIDPEGGVVAEAGGRGDGPDEFAGPAGLARLSADTVLVWDAGARAVVAYLDGARVRRWAVPPYAGGSLDSPVALADGSLVFPGRVAMGDRPLDADGRTRFDGPLLRWDRVGEGFDTVAFVPTDEIMTMRIGGRSALGVPPYAATTTVAARGDRIVVGDGAARVDARGRGWMQVDVLDREGALVARYRAPAPRGAVEPSDRESYLRALERRARTPQEVAMLPALRTSLVFPERHPAYGGLRVGDDGTLWLRTGPVTPPAPPAGPWTVLDPDGALLGTVEVPEGFELRAVDGEFLTGIWRDDLDVQHLRVYRLRR